MLNVSTPVVWRKPEEGDCGARQRKYFTGSAAASRSPAGVHRPDPAVLRNQALRGPQMNLRCRSDQCPNHQLSSAATLLRGRVCGAVRALAISPGIPGKTPQKTANLCAECIIGVLTRAGPVRRNTGMAFLAHIFRLIRVAAACAVILVLGFSLPSAAHAVAGHHGNTPAAHSGSNHDGAAGTAAAQDVSEAGAHERQGAPQQAADTGNCCSGACMAVAVISLQPAEIALKRPVRWRQEASQLPSRQQNSLLRPPKA